MMRFSKYGSELLVLGFSLLVASPAVSGEQHGGIASGLEKLQLHRPLELESEPRARFLVGLFGDDEQVDELAAALRRDYELELVTVFRSALLGLVVECDFEVAQRLAADARVRLVEQDVVLDRPWPTPASAKAFESKGTAGPPTCFADDGSFQLVPYPASSPDISWGPSCPEHDSCTGNWGLDRIDDRQGLDGSYQPTVGPHLVDVFIIDSGVALGHAELSQVPVDETRLGMGDFSPHYHGSHVAGIVAGKNFGVAQHGLRFHTLNLGASTSLAKVISGFEEAYMRRTKGVPVVVSLSQNGVELAASRTLGQVVRRAVAGNISVVNSAGNLRFIGGQGVTCDTVFDPGQQSENFSFASPLYPPEVMIVGATDDQDRLYCECGDLPSGLYDCASRVGAVDFFAPGADIVSMSAEGDGSICRLSGTSMAAPHAAGAAALLLSRFPDASPGAVERGLVRMSTAGAVSTHSGGGVAGGRLLYVGGYSSSRPVAGSQYFFAYPGETLTISKNALIAGDFDWQGRALSVTGVGGASNGQLSDLGSAVRFTVDADAAPSLTTASSASFNYSITNGLKSDSAKVRIIVLPSTLDDHVVFGGSGPFDIELEDLLANEGLTPDDVSCQAPIDTLTAGTVQVRLEAGKCVGYRYTPPDPSFAGTDVFEYVLTLHLGGQRTVKAYVHSNDPAYPTPLEDAALVDYPGHQGRQLVEVPTGAYVVVWGTSRHTGITEYRLTETVSATGQSTVIYAGDGTHFAVSGRSSGVRTYTVQACTPLACSAPSPVRDTYGFGGEAFSVVDVQLSPCSPSSVCNPLPGLWYDPARSGNGIDFQRDAAGRWQIMLFTYRQADATPIWYRATAARQSGRRILAVLEELRSTGGTGVEVEQFGFLEMDLWSASTSTLRIYRFSDLVPGQHGFENQIFEGSYQYLGGMPSGVSGQWRPADGAQWGLVLTQLPTEPDGSTAAFATTHFFRPDGSPTWTSTRAGSIIPSPQTRYRGTAWPLHRRGINLCLECTGTPLWDDTYLGGGVFVDILDPLHTNTGSAQVTIPIGSGVDPAFPAGYTQSYTGTIVKVTR